jgi:hypothetical protein
VLGPRTGAAGVFLAKRHNAFGNFITNLLSNGFKVRTVASRENFKPKGVLVYKAPFIRGFRAAFIGGVLFASAFTSVSFYDWLYPIEYFPQNVIVVTCAVISAWLLPMWVIPSFGRRAVTRIWIENNWWIHVESHNRLGGLRHVRTPVGFIRVPDPDRQFTRLTALRQYLLGIKLHNEWGFFYLRKKGRFVDKPGLKTILSQAVVQELIDEDLLRPIALPPQVLDDQLFPPTSTRFIYDLERSQELKNPMPMEDGWIERLKFWKKLRRFYMQRKQIWLRRKRMQEEGRARPALEDKYHVGLLESGVEGAERKIEEVVETTEEAAKHAGIKESMVVVGNELVHVDDLTVDDLQRIRTYPIIPPCLEESKLKKGLMKRAERRTRGGRAMVNEELDDHTTMPKLTQLEIFDGEVFDGFFDAHLFSPREVGMLKEYGQIGFYKVYDTEVPIANELCEVGVSPQVPAKLLDGVQWQMVNRRVGWNEMNTTKGYCRRAAIRDVLGEDVMKRIEYPQGTGWISKEYYPKHIDRKFGKDFDERKFLSKLDDDQRAAYFASFEKYWTAAQEFIKHQRLADRGYALSTYAMDHAEYNDIVKLIEQVNNDIIHCGWTLEGGLGQKVQIGRKFKKDTRSCWKRTQALGFRPRRFGKKRWSNNWNERMVFDPIRPRVGFGGRPNRRARKIRYSN